MRMKRFAPLTVAVFLCTVLTPSITEARWIGQYKKDLSVQSMSRLQSGRAAARQAILSKQPRTILNLRTPIPGEDRSEIFKNPDVRPYFTRRQLKVFRRDESLRLRSQRRIYTEPQIAKHILNRLDYRIEARRKAHLADLLGILSSYSISLDPEKSALIPEENREICKAYASSCDGLLDLKPLLKNEGIKQLPIDPVITSEENGTGYFVQRIGKGLILSAPNSRQLDGMIVDWQP